MLTKSPRYYYDIDAIREPHTSGKSGGRQYAQKKGLKLNKRPANGQPKGNGHNAYGLDNPLGRNRRSVWTVATKPFSGAHFATFPLGLIEPCVLAGSPREGVVLDPFNGAGTTGVVSGMHGRNYIGIELNPDYLAMADERIGKIYATANHEWTVKADEVTVEELPLFKGI